MTSKKDQSFPTWSFDQFCQRMEWNELADVEITVSPPSAAGELLEEIPALLILGIKAPPATATTGSASTATTITPKGDETSKEEEPSIPMARLSDYAQIVDTALGGLITTILKETINTFKQGATVGATTSTIRVVVSPPGKTPTTTTQPSRIVLLGMGSVGSPVPLSGNVIGKAIATICAAETHVNTCHVSLPIELDLAFVHDLSCTLFHSLRADNRYRTGANQKKPAEHLSKICIVPVFSLDDPITVEESTTWAEIVEGGRQRALGVLLAKDIVNAPHNVLNSVSLADTARRIAEESGGCITCTILDKEACEARGMGAYLGVARGSESPPQFIHLVYKPPQNHRIQRKVAVVGKGLLFDTGGYNIKTAMMELMKFDCGGAAAVLGGARVVGAMKPNAVEAHFIVAACENMINDRAMVPSDILTASNGKTIEVLNTDAEGRLTLADALVYADEEIGCDKIIELSTLTGAMMVALGKLYAGVFTQDDDLAKELEEVSKATGEKTWRMPMVAEYKEQLESKIADLSNIGQRWGGSITAALFLQNFVDSKKPFAHIDIAGPVWSDKEGVATGYGARLVAEWVARQRY